jgi:glycosyltransferase involved in cell wall biosynthesis
MNNGTQIVGAVLVKNENIFIRQVIQNALEFCDHLIVTDNLSSDGTYTILQELAAQHPKIELMQIEQHADSHQVIEKYAGTKTWVFGLDGDEIYDPRGLWRLRSKLLAGEYDGSWSVFGNVLNCVELDAARTQARGYLAPPCRSMTKLYNFAAINSWAKGPERLLGEELIQFKPGYHAGLRLALHEQMDWDESFYRCLHVCFMPRSTAEKNLPEQKLTARPNPADLRKDAQLQAAAKKPTWWKRWFSTPKPALQSDWKREKYARGALVEKNVAAFFDSSTAR